jgi:hypothetical protein
LHTRSPVTTTGGDKKDKTNLPATFMMSENLLQRGMKLQISLRNCHDSWRVGTQHIQQEKKALVLHAARTLQDKNSVFSGGVTP